MKKKYEKKDTQISECSEVKIRVQRHAHFEMLRSENMRKNTRTFHNVLKFREAKNADNSKRMIVK